MRLGLELIDRKIVDAGEPHSAFNKELRSAGIEVNKFFVEFSVLPVFGILGLEQNSFGRAAPVQALQIGPPNRADTGNIKNRGFSDERIERELVQPFSAIDHMERRIDMG